MELHTMPKETLAELLFFLAENEEFNAVKETLIDGFTVEEVRASLRELAEGLRKEAGSEVTHQYNAQKDVRLSKEAKDITSYLSPGEEKSLLTAFGLVEKQKSVVQNSNLAPRSKS